MSIGVSAEQIIDLHPRLYHMATGGSWPSLQAHGLLPTTHLVGTSGLAQTRQRELLGERRPQSVTVTHPIYGEVVIRDQKPLRECFLSDVLDDVTVPEWLSILNDRVFFWLTTERLTKLMHARAYRNLQQDVLTIDTASLLRAHQASVRLSPLNSGAVPYRTMPKRGTATFSTLETFPFAELRAKRGARKAIVELAVIGGVPDLSLHVLAVDRYLGTTHQQSLFGNSPPV